MAQNRSNFADAYRKIYEKLKPSDGAGAYIDDFRKSDAPQFKGKSDKKIQKMAVAAYLDDKDKAKKEDKDMDPAKHVARSKKNPDKFCVFDKDGNMVFVQWTPFTQTETKFIDDSDNADPSTLTIDTDGTFIMKKDGTEFSVANSAYAGMILGYRMIGEDAGHDAYALTTSFAVPHADMTTRFIAPPSGNVEVMVQIFMNSSTSNKFLYLGLSDNATYNSIGVQYEHNAQYPDETDDGTIQHFWTITGLTAGDTYNYWLGAKTSGTNKFLNWGGDASGRYPDFIMKVTALPAATSDFAVYG